MFQPLAAEVEIIEWDSVPIPSYTSDTTQSATVDIYVTEWCPYCRQAIAYLRANGIAFNRYDIEKDTAAASRKKRLAPSYSGVPLAVINGKIVKGYTKEAYEEALF